VILNSVYDIVHDLNGRGAKSLLRYNNIIVALCIMLDDDYFLFQIIESLSPHNIMIIIVMISVNARYKFRVVEINRFCRMMDA